MRDLDLHGFLHVGGVDHRLGSLERIVQRTLSVAQKLGIELDQLLASDRSGFADLGAVRAETGQLREHLLVTGQALLDPAGPLVDGVLGGLLRCARNLTGGIGRPVVALASAIGGDRFVSSATP